MYSPQLDSSERFEEHHCIRRGLVRGGMLVLANRFLPPTQSISSIMWTRRVLDAI